MFDSPVQQEMETDGIEYDTAYSLAIAQESIHKAVSTCSSSTLNIIKDFYPQLIDIAIDFGTRAKLRNTFD